MKRTRIDGMASSLPARIHASRSIPCTFLRGGVWGRVRLYAAITKDTIAATMKIDRVSCAVGADPSRKTKGQLTTIHPIVPPIRTNPKSFAGSRRCANASELATEIVGTYKRQYNRKHAKNPQKDVMYAAPRSAKA